MTSEAVSEATTSSKSYVGRVTSAIEALRHDIQEGRISPGDQAALRRGWKDGPGPAFWRLAMSRLEPHGLARSVMEEQRWSIIVAGLVETRGLTHRGASFGRAAAQAEVAEMRLFRLLRAHDETLHKLLRGVITQITAAGLGFNWRDPALLILFDGKDNQALTCRRIARDFYSYQPHES